MYERVAPVIRLELVRLLREVESLAYLRRENQRQLQLLKGVPAKINLIPFNPWPGSGYECSSWSTIEAFAAILNRGGYASPIRTPRGRDILAACGQLKSESEKQRASVRRKATLSE